jgi:pectate lyase
MYHLKERNWNSPAAHAVFSLSLGLAACLQFAAPAPAAPATELYPGEHTWAASTVGGRGGKIIRVTNLNSEGPGSFREAVATKGPRIVVFEVGGVIDLETKSIRITEPFLTIAGQTAPDPGITFIRAEICPRDTHDIVIQHIRVRTGEAGHKKKSGWNEDGISTWSSYNVVVDHCSCTWATDESLSASGPQFNGGPTVDDWRQHASHRITFSNCIIAEGLSHSTHAKGEHSKGTLIHDNATEVAIIGNLYANNVQRNPLLKGGVQAVIVNNFIANPGQTAMHYGLVGTEWGKHEYVTGKVSVVGNVMEYGPSTSKTPPLFRFGYTGPVEVYLEDNIAKDKSNRDVPMLGGDNLNLCKQVDQKPVWPEGLRPLPASQVKEYVAKNAGARPWNRDAIDERIVREALGRTGKIIDSEQEVGGYPAMAPATHAAFVPEQWDLTTMQRRG